MLAAIKRIMVGEPVGATVVYQREQRVLEAVRALIPNQPYELGGRYSWLTSPVTDHELQLDIFFPRIVRLGKVNLTTPRALAIEVQSSLHDGKWNVSKRFYFKKRAEFEVYTKNQQWKREQLRRLRIPLLEIDPSVETLDADALTQRLFTVLGIAR